MIQSQLEAIGYLVSGRHIVETTYAEYLRDYGSDDITSPCGMEPRIHIREKEYELDAEEQENYESSGSFTKYEVWSWGIGGNNPSYTGNEYDTEEEAELDVYEHFEYYINNTNSNAPSFLDSKKDAIEHLSDALNKPIDVVARYVNWLEKTETKEAIEKKEREAAYDRERAALKLAVLAEVNGIAIDTEFANDMIMAQMLAGATKNDFCANAMNNFLRRNKIDKINSDYWQVFRLLKARVN